MKFDEGSNKRGWSYYSQCVNCLALYSYRCIILYYFYSFTKPTDCLLSLSGTAHDFDFNLKMKKKICVVEIMYTGLFSSIFFALQHLQMISPYLEFTQTQLEIYISTLSN